MDKHHTPPPGRSIQSDLSKTAHLAGAVCVPIERRRTAPVKTVDKRIDKRAHQPALLGQVVDQLHRLDHAVFDESPVALEDWLRCGGDPGYERLVNLAEVDGLRGDWVLLDASFHEGAPDGRELRGEVRSMFVPVRAVAKIAAEIAAGRELFDNGFVGLGADYYTFHGEVPWSQAYGSDVRTASGRARRSADRAFDYFSAGWRPGIAVEGSVRAFSWEPHHSDMNQTQVVFPAPPIAEFLDLRVVGGSSDMRDVNGKVATIYRDAPGPGFGSHFLYMRRDLLNRYLEARHMTMLHAIRGQRSVSHRLLDRNKKERTRQLFSREVSAFGSVLGLPVDVCS